METTERVVEAYCRYIKKWATIPNIKCDGQYEIDLLAIDPVTNERYHIEVGVSISAGFSSLNNRPFSRELLKQRLEAAKQRRTIGYFIERKFAPIEVKRKLREYGVRRGKYTRVIVSWGWNEQAKAVARVRRILLWDFRDLLHEIAFSFREKRTYFTDDTLRTLQLFARSIDLIDDGQDE